MTGDLGFACTILGTVDLSGLDGRPGLWEAERILTEQSAAALRVLLDWYELDVYLMVAGVNERPVSVRWRGVPVDCSPIHLDPMHEGDLTRVPAFIDVWITRTDNPTASAPQLVAEVPNSNVVLPYSGAVAAVAFREAFGMQARTIPLNLGTRPGSGSVIFTPRQVEYPFWANKICDQTPKLKRAYTSTEIRNYNTHVTRHRPDWAVWMWLTDPATGAPGPRWWRLSEIVLSEQATVATLGAAVVDLDHAEAQRGQAVAAGRTWRGCPMTEDPPTAGLMWPEYAPFGRHEPPPYRPPVLII